MPLDRTIKVLLELMWFIPAAKMAQVMKPTHFASVGELALMKKGCS